MEAVIIALTFMFIGLSFITLVIIVKRFTDNAKKQIRSVLYKIYIIKYISGDYEIVCRKKPPVIVNDMYEIREVTEFDRFRLHAQKVSNNFYKINMEVD